ncbi:hypothetical protein [Anabaena sp. UHCC 0451]|uniref:hypothetical protein n=1 Tax=Anabaena sp. UHCC 0451 TaxID=2055235 RepID=UPI002B1F5277|nr:hypothetical protein [Anabaena sp. UHCC 0451]MEA5577415.1 hypothetical protein [Anabaena sp. UHCC 0451]
MKSSVYRNLAVITCALGLLGLVAGCLGLSVSFDSNQPDVLLKLAKETPTLANVISTDEANVTNAATKQVKKPSSENLPHQSQGLGSLRMSNQTIQPVRLALLARKSAVKRSSTTKQKYNLPAHWDFAPQEGSQKGLILSLPEGSLKLEKGDILVAFAQDGSRRYWGPYVVGETSSPNWNSQTKEWQLILTP